MATRSGRCKMASCHVAMLPCWQDGIAPYPYANIRIIHNMVTATGAAPTIQHIHYFDRYLALLLLLRPCFPLIAALFIGVGAACLYQLSCRYVDTGHGFTTFGGGVQNSTVQGEHTLPWLPCKRTIVHKMAHVCRFVLWGRCFAPSAHKQDSLFGMFGSPDMIA